MLLVCSFYSFNNVAFMEYVRVPVFNPSLIRLPLRACSHIPSTAGSTPLQPLHDRPVPAEPSNVSAPESATPATPSSSAANCSAAGLFERREPAPEPRKRQNTGTKYHLFVFSFTTSVVNIKSLKQYGSQINIALCCGHTMVIKNGNSPACIKRLELPVSLPLLWPRCV